MLLSVLLFPLLLVASPAMATETPAATAPVSDDDKVRCRKIDVTGSATRKLRVCRTRAEWREMAEVGNRNARDLLRDNSICGADLLCNGRQ